MKVDGNFKEFELNNKFIKESKYPITQSEPIKKHKTATTKYVLSGLGAVGAIAVALLAIKRGKTPKNINIDSFKEAGHKFVKGNAFLKNGKPFTGAIEIIQKDGSKVVVNYENGVLKTSQKFKQMKDGRYMPSSMKVYNYSESGKLESVKDKVWAHVSTIDPQNHGFQWIETKTHVLDDIRQKGLENFKLKQAKQAEMRKTMQQFESKSNANINKYLDDLDTIDEFGVGQSYTNDYINLKRQYANLERLQEITAQNKEKVKQLGEKLDGRISVNVSGKDEKLEELNSWYRALENRTPEQVRESIVNVEQKIADDLEKAFNKSVLENDTSTIGCIRASLENKFKNAWTLYGQEFRPVNYTITIGGKKYHILYEGIDYLVTIDHKLIRKVRCDNKETKFVDVFESMLEKALKQLKEEEIAYAEKLKRIRENASNCGQNIHTTRPVRVQVLGAR